MPITRPRTNYRATFKQYDDKMFGPNHPNVLVVQINNQKHHIFPAFGLLFQIKIGQLWYTKSSGHTERSKSSSTGTKCHNKKESIESVTTRCLNRFYNPPPE